MNDYKEKFYIDIGHHTFMIKGCCTFGVNDLYLGKLLLWDILLLLNLDLPAPGIWLYYAYQKCLICSICDKKKVPGNILPMQLQSCICSAWQIPVCFIAWTDKILLTSDIFLYFDSFMVMIKKNVVHLFPFPTLSSSQQCYVIKCQV